MLQIKELKKQPPRRFENDVYYFLTILTFKRKCILNNFHNNNIVLHTIMYLCKDLHLKLIAYVILENHIHLLLYVKNSDSIPQFLRRFKSYTSRQIIKNLSSEDRHIWQRGTFDHVIRDDDDLWTHIDYIHYNPVKHEYIKSQRNWKWSSFKQYIKNGYYKYGFCKDNNVNNKYYNYGEYDM